MKSLGIKFSVQSIISIIVFSGLSALGGVLKIPSTLGSIALDSAPGYFCAVYFNPLLGGIVGFIGHLCSALTAGFPLGLNHLFVALQMFFWCFIFGFIIRKFANMFGVILAFTVCLLLNGLGSPLLLVISPVNSLPMATAKVIIPILLLASAANILLAILAYRMISKLKISGL